MSSTSEVTSTWKVASAIPGRIRVRHDAIGDRRRAPSDRGGAGGDPRRDPGPRPAADLGPPGALRPGRDHPAATAPGPGGSGRAVDSRPAPAGHLPPARFAMVNGSLALAVAGELAVPALLPASAVLLVASSVRRGPRGVARDPEAADRPAGPVHDDPRRDAAQRAVPGRGPDGLDVPVLAAPAPRGAASHCGGSCCRR